MKKNFIATLSLLISILFLTSSQATFADPDSSLVPCIQSQLAQDLTGLGDPNDEGGSNNIWMSCGSTVSSTRLWTKNCTASATPATTIGPVPCDIAPSAMLKMCNDNAGMGTYPSTSEGRCALDGLNAARAALPCNKPSCTVCTNDTTRKCKPESSAREDYTISPTLPYSPNLIIRQNEEDGSPVCSIQCYLGAPANYTITYRMYCRMFCNDINCYPAQTSPAHPALPR